LALVPGLVAEDFEFIELMNTGAVSLELGGAYFDKCITFTFPTPFELDSKERCVVVASRTAFELRHGAGIRIAGEFEGALDNGGEKVRIFDRMGEEVLAFTYDDDWFPIPVGQYRSFVTRSDNPGYDSYDTPTTWALSGSVHGTPAVADSFHSQIFEGWRRDYFAAAEIPTALDPERPGALLADPDGDGFNNFSEYAFGRIPLVADHSGALITPSRLVDSGAEYLCITFRRAKAALDVVYIVECASDISSATQWTPSGVWVSSTDLGNGLEEVCFRDSVSLDATKRYMRVRVVQR
jgi:hypothetical protein